MSRRRKPLGRYSRRPSPPRPAPVEPPPDSVRRLAGRNGLWVLAEGRRGSPAWLVYCKTTGLLAFTYTPADKRWWAGTTVDNGVAASFYHALTAWKRLGKPLGRTTAGGGGTAAP